MSLIAIRDRTEKDGFAAKSVFASDCCLCSSQCHRPCDLRKMRKAGEMLGEKVEEKKRKASKENQDSP